MNLKMPRYLLCPPDYYEVSYIINPWMKPATWAAEKSYWTERSRTQWAGLKNTMHGLGWQTDEISGMAGLPDMVFAANHAFVLDNKAVISRFCTAERDGETAHIKHWFAAQGFEVHDSKYVFEGGGDALYDPSVDIIWLGYGFRSSALMKDELERLYGKRVIPLALKNDYYYHCDTCFCPLRNRWAMLTVEAFTQDALQEIRAVYGEKIITVTPDDARHFACNAVVFENNIVMPLVSDALQTRLNQIGFKVHMLPLDSYILAGGASRCLTLRLDD